MIVEQLKHRILEARDRGDQRELERLQAEYRLTAEVNSADRGMAVRPIRVSAGRTRAGTRTHGSPSTHWPLLRIASYVYGELRAAGGEDLEAGGWLVCKMSGHDLVVTRMVGQADYRERSSQSVALDPAIARGYDLAPDEFIGGDWHSHPQGTHSKPSAGDVRAWDAAREAFRRPWWCGVVVRDEDHGAFGLQGHLVAYIGAAGDYRQAAIGRF